MVLVDALIVLLTLLSAVWGIAGLLGYIYLYVLAFQIVHSAETVEEKVSSGVFWFLIILMCTSSIATAIHSCLLY